MREFTDQQCYYQTLQAEDYLRKGGDFYVWANSKDFSKQDLQKICSLLRSLEFPSAQLTSER